MFIKSFRIKTQTQVKGSERKKLRAELAAHFPTLTSDELSELIPTKSDLTLVKVYCYKGESVHIYQIEKEPLFFMLEKEKKIYPTVYTLWRHPELTLSFTTHPPVIQNLANGADLMLPGIVLKGEPCPNMYGKFEKETTVSVNTTANRAPCAVGFTANDSIDMYMAARHGKGVVVLHVYGDYLWQMGSKNTPPLISHPVEDLQLSDQEDDENTPSACEDDGNNDDNDEACDMIDDLDINDPDDANTDYQLEEIESQPTVSDSELMDQLLEHCLLKAIKTSLRKVELPILASNLYAQHIIPACPDNKRLDVKKSSYKKLSKFLSEMEKRKIIVIKNFPKGTDSLHEINYNHDDVKSFIVDKTETTVKVIDGAGNTFIPPLIEELFQVSGPTIDFFRANKLSKGDVLSSSDIRKIVTDYINKENLKKANSNLVNLNPLLHQAVVGPKEGFKETLRWDEIFSRLLGKMSPCTRITRHSQPSIIRKGKLEPIQIEVAKRTKNKKVTLIYNASIYGIDETEFAHQIQVGVAASTSVGPAENRPQGTTQVLVQGSQVSFIARLLLETYKIPRKYIKGLELAAKEKKQKH